MIQFRIDTIKSVIAEIIDDNGQPTGEFVEITDDSGLLLESELQGKFGVAEEVMTSAGDTVPHWSIVSRDC